MKKNADGRDGPPKIRRTWKIKPYTRVHADEKSYDRRRQREEEEREIAEALPGEGPGERARSADRSSAGQAPGPDDRFCPRCGGPLGSRMVGDRRRLVCSRCGHVLYRNPAPAVAVIIPRGERIVLVRRAEEPRRGDWCLPAGFLEMDETPEQCAVRETREETGLEIRVSKLLGVDIGRDDPRTRVVLIIYLAELLGGELQAGDDASEAGWFGPGELPRRIAFAAHRWAIAGYFGEDRVGGRHPGNHRQEDRHG